MVKKSLLIYNKLYNKEGKVFWANFWKSLDKRLLKCYIEINKEINKQKEMKRWHKTFMWFRFCKLARWSEIERLCIDNDKLIIHDTVIVERYLNQFIMDITEYDYSIKNIQNLLIKTLELKGFLSKVKYVYDIKKEQTA